MQRKYSESLIKPYMTKSLPLNSFSRCTAFGAWSNPKAVLPQPSLSCSLFSHLGLPGLHTLHFKAALSGRFLWAILTGRIEALWELESANHTEWSTTTSIVLKADNESHKERQAEEDGENSWNGKFIEC